MVRRASGLLFLISLCQEDMRSCRMAMVRRLYTVNSVQLCLYYVPHITGLISVQAHKTMFNKHNIIILSLIYTVLSWSTSGHRFVSWVIIGSLNVYNTLCPITAKTLSFWPITAICDMTCHFSHTFHRWHVYMFLPRVLIGLLHFLLP